MNNGRCTVCPGKCSYNMHYHDRRLIKPVNKTLTHALSSLSNTYAKAAKDRVECELKSKTVQETKRFIDHLLQEQTNKVREACVRVQSNCEGFNIAEELCTFIRLLKNDMNKLRSPTVIQKATKFIQNLEILANDNSLKLRRRSQSLSHNRRIRSSKKRNQSQIISTSNNDDLMIFGQVPMTSLMQQTNRLYNFPDCEKYAEYTTDELIDITRQSIDKLILIVKELNFRCEGNSIWCLSPVQLLTLCKYYTACRHLKSDELTRLYAQLQLEVKQSNDICTSEVSALPTDSLLHLTAIKLCLESIKKNS